MGREPPLPLRFSSMFNFSANHLSLFSRTERPTCAVFLLQDLDTQRVYRLYDFSKALLIRPGQAYCVAGKVNSADRLYLVIESVRPDTRHARRSTSHAPADGAGGSLMA
jgi:hypothetical protein